jgi:uncharacterized protein involved in exopolysaccharide biosynthesis
MDAYRQVDEGPDEAFGPFLVARWLYRQKWFLLATTFGAAIVAAGISLTIPRSYHAIAELRPIVTDLGESPFGAGSAGGLGGLASAVLGGGKAATDDTAVTLAMMTSLQFDRRFVTEHNLMPELFPDRWDSGSRSWKGVPPRLDDAAQALKDRIKIDQDPATGIIDMEVIWQSPERAVQIAQAFIDAVNKARGQQVLAHATRNLDYLEQSLAKEPIQEMRNTIANLASRELTRKMLAQSMSDYALEVVNPPYGPIYPVAPRRTVITLVGALIGFVVGVLFRLVRSRD